MKNVIDVLKSLPMPLPTFAMMKILVHTCNSMANDSLIADCGCNMDGSLTLQCNENGKCECKANITGEKCDRCANDNISFPNCTTTIATTSATRTGNFTTSSDII